MTVFLFVDISTRESRSELLANLHLIKLFLHDTLRFEETFQWCGALSKLEGACIDAAFAEIREEDYADDGLFFPMGQFFLPLTISEEEIKQTRTTIPDQARLLQLEHYMKNIQSLQISVAAAMTHQNDIEQELILFNQSKEQAHVAYMNNRSRVAAMLSACKQSKEFPLKNIFKARKQAKELREIDQQWMFSQEEIDEKVRECEMKLTQARSCVADSNQQIDDLDTRMNNLHRELTRPKRAMDTGLVKPARGLIMYGPPGRYRFFSFSIFDSDFLGTGKSEIKSKLSTKLGVVMVSPHLYQQVNLIVR